MHLYVVSTLLISTCLAVVQGQAVPLEPFGSVETCINGAVGIQPSKDSSYSYEIQGNPDFAKYYSATVKDGVLYVQNEAADFSGERQGNIVIVNVPSDALASVKTTGNGLVSVLPGFSASEFDLTTEGNGAVEIDIDVSDTLTLDSSGNGLVAVSGSSGTLDATLTGNGQVSVYGLQGNAKIDVSGNGPVFIGGSETTAITGTHTSFSPLSYQGASCDVTGESTFSPGCVKETRPAPKPVALPTVGTSFGGISSGSCGVSAVTTPASSTTTTASPSPEATPEATEATPPPKEATPSPVPSTTASPTDIPSPPPSSVDTRTMMCKSVLMAILSTLCIVAI